VAKDKEYEEMYGLYLSGKTMKEISEQIGITVAAISKGFKIRGYVTRNSSWPRKRESVLSKIDDTFLVKHRKGWATLDPKVKGTIAESHIKRRLAKVGFDVWLPYANNHKADMGIYQLGRLARIQVKSATYDLPTKRFRTMLQTRDKQRNHIAYNLDDVDFFIIFCPGIADIYIIPAIVGCKHHSVSLLPHRDRIYRGTGIDWELYKNAFALLQEADNR